MTVVIVTGVGTEIGKTHMTAALALAWGAWAPVLAYKPIESGVTAARGADEGLLASVSTFHVKRPLLQIRLRAAVSPHLAARAEGASVDVSGVVREIDRLRSRSDVLVELPGGLFSPLTDALVNADLALRVRPDRLLLVAPDRLGVLHDVRAVMEACRARGLPIFGVVLNAPETPDASTHANAAELALTCGLPVLAQIPRASIEALSSSPVVRELARLCRVET